MADDFERALLITFDYRGGVDAALKERATAFVNDVKKNPDAWRLCCERFSTSAYTEIKFWCLQTLLEVYLVLWGVAWMGSVSALAHFHCCTDDTVLIRLVPRRRQSRGGLSLIAAVGGSHATRMLPQVKAALLTWIQRDCLALKGSGLPSFLRNKLAQTLVSVLQVAGPRDLSSDQNCPNTSLD